MSGQPPAAATVSSSAASAPSAESDLARWLGSANRSEAAQCIKSGWLETRYHTLNSWRQRWFVLWATKQSDVAGSARSASTTLGGQLLMFFKNKSADKPEGFMSLTVHGSGDESVVVLNEHGKSFLWSHLSADNQATALDMGYTQATWQSSGAAHLVIQSSSGDANDAEALLDHAAARSQGFRRNLWIRPQDEEDDGRDLSEWVHAILRLPDRDRDQTSSGERMERVAVLYENQRRIAVFGLGGKFCASSLLLTDRPPWSNHDGSKNYAQGLASPGLLPRGGKWSGEWVAGIWVHAFNFSHLGLRAKWSTKAYPTDSVRRRKWARPYTVPMPGCAPGTPGRWGDVGRARKLSNASDASAYDDAMDDWAYPWSDDEVEGEGSLSERENSEERSEHPHADEATHGMTASVHGGVHCHGLVLRLRRWWTCLWIGVLILRRQYGNELLIVAAAVVVAVATWFVAR